MKARLLELLQRLNISAAIIAEIMKGGGTMTYTFLALNVIQGLNTLDDFKNKRLRKLVEKELIKMGYAELVEQANKK
jgi:hypothetical protein